MLHDAIHLIQVSFSYTFNYLSQLVARQVLKITNFKVNRWDS